MTAASLLKNSGLGLDGIGDLSALLDGSGGDNQGGRSYISVDLIDEDPEQPRLESNGGFSHASLSSLAKTIKARGLKYPITVRDHPTIPGRYMINDGARRFRAVKNILGLTTIPVEIDNNFESIDQLIANAQREDNTPMEYAASIEKLLKKGMRKNVIADELGKSVGWVTTHSALLNLPQIIRTVFDSGRLSDVNIAYELVKLNEKFPTEVSDWINDKSQEFTRGQLKIFREFLESKQARANQQSEDELLDSLMPRDEDEQNGGDDDHNPLSAQQAIEPTIPPVQPPKNDSNTRNEEIGGAGQQTQPDRNNSRPSSQSNDPEKFKKAIVMVQHDGRSARIVLDKRPSACGWAWFKYEDDGHVFEDMLANVSLVELVEG